MSNKGNLEVEIARLATSARLKLLERQNSMSCNLCFSLLNYRIMLWMHANESCISKLLLTNRLINTIFLNLSMVAKVPISKIKFGSNNLRELCDSKLIFYHLWDVREPFRIIFDGRAFYEAVSSKFDQLIKLRICMFDCVTKKFISRFIHVSLSEDHRRTQSWVQGRAVQDSLQRAQPSRRLCLWRCVDYSPYFAQLYLSTSTAKRNQKHVIGRLWL